MRPRFAALATVLCALAAPAGAHNLDEYLEATTLALEPGRVRGELRLTPGVAVFAKVYAAMDTNQDGVLSPVEQRAYAGRVLADLSLQANGTRRPLHADAWQFPSKADMQAGRGEILLKFSAETADPAVSRTLVYENRHQSALGVYLVNCLASDDPRIRVTAQSRNYEQSLYRLHYTVGPAPNPDSAVRGRLVAGVAATALVLLLLPLARRRTG